MPARVNPASTVQVRSSSAMRYSALSSQFSAVSPVGASVMVTNDTGPRHLAAALKVPVVTVFGPTDPRWTEIDFKDERVVRVEVFCGPCQKKRCPLDHRCMTQVSASMVFERVAGLLADKGVRRLGATA